MKITLRRRDARFFRAEGAGPVNRSVELHVRSADRDRATHLAAMIFARRRRMGKNFPRRNPTLDTPGFASEGAAF